MRPSFACVTGVSLSFLSSSTCEAHIWWMVARSRPCSPDTLSRLLGQSGTFYIQEEKNCYQQSQLCCWITLQKKKKIYDLITNTGICIDGIKPSWIFCFSYKQMKCSITCNTFLCGLLTIEFYNQRNNLRQQLRWKQHMP